MRNLILLGCIGVVTCGQVWSLNDPSYPNTPSSPTKFINTIASRYGSYGKQDWSSPSSVTGKVKNIDCISYKCRAASTSTSGRQLGHGQGSASAPAGWRPDLSKPLSGIVPCDITTVVDSTSVRAAGNLIAAYAFTWFVNCIVYPRSSDALKTIPAAGFIGIIHMHPCDARTGRCSGYKQPFRAVLNDPNVIPSTPYVVVTNRAFIPGQGMDVRADEVGFESYLIRQFRFYNNATYSSMEVWATLTADKNAIMDVTTSVGFLFAYRLYATIFAAIALYSLYALYKSQNKCSWLSYVVFVEGFLSGVFRVMRCSIGPMLWNGNTTLDFSVWLNDTAENPLAVSTTFVTFFVWCKIVYGRPIPRKLSLVLNMLVALLTGFFVVVPNVFGLFNPLQPWIKYNPFGSSSELRNFSNDPYVYSSITITSLFVVTFCIAIFKILRASASSSSKSLAEVRKKLKWMILQACGVIVGVLAQYVIKETTSQGDSYPLIDTVFYATHMREIGNLMSAVGQVIALSSSSSSSSS